METGCKLGSPDKFENDELYSNAITQQNPHNKIHTTKSKRERQRDRERQRERQRQRQTERQRRTETDRETDRETESGIVLDLRKNMMINLVFNYLLTKAIEVKCWLPVNHKL